MGNESKATTAGLGAMIGAIIVWVIGLFGVVIPPEVSAAFAGLIAFGLAYVLPAKK